LNGRLFFLPQHFPRESGEYFGWIRHRHIHAFFKTFLNEGENAADQAAKTIDKIRLDIIKKIE
jgi:hypothetical protein